MVGSIAIVWRAPLDAQDKRFSLTQIDGLGGVSRTRTGDERDFDERAQTCHRKKINRPVEIRAFDRDFEIAGRAVESVEIGR